MSLLDMATQYEQAQPKEFSEAPAGRYQVVCDDAEEVLSKSGNTMVKWKWRIMNGAHKGEYIFDNMVFTDKTLPYIKAKLAKIGYSDSLEDFAHDVHSGGIKGLQIEIDRKTRGIDGNGNPNWNNNWIKRIEVDQTSVDGELSLPPMDGMPF
jgi:hypothetical protein